MTDVTPLLFQGTNLWPLIYSIGYFLQERLVYGMCWFGCTGWTWFLYRVVLLCIETLQKLALSNRVRLVWYPWKWESQRTCKSGIKFCFCGARASSSVGTFECQREGAAMITSITLRLMELVVSRRCGWKNQIQAAWIHSRSYSEFFSANVKMTRSVFGVLIDLNHRVKKNTFFHF
jgi:hypothetical protein